MFLFFLFFFFFIDDKQTNVQRYTLFNPESIKQGVCSRLWHGNEFSSTVDGKKARKLDLKSVVWWHHCHSIQIAATMVFPLSMLELLLVLLVLLLESLCRGAARVPTGWRFTGACETVEEYIVESCRTGDRMSSMLNTAAGKYASANGPMAQSALL